MKQIKNLLIFGPCSQKTGLFECEQQRRRSNSASASSDYRLCFSLVVRIVAICAIFRNFDIIASHCSGAGRFQFNLVATPKRGYHVKGISKIK